MVHGTHERMMVASCREIENILGIKGGWCSQLMVGVCNLQPTFGK